MNLLTLIKLNLSRKLNVASLSISSRTRGCVIRAMESKWNYFYNKYLMGSCWAARMPSLHSD